MKFLKQPRFLFLLILTLLAAACSQETPWAGVSKSEDNEIFVSYDRFVAKLDANGKRQWTFPDKDNREAQFFAPVVYEDDRVYVGDYRGHVYALDRETGDQIWAHEVNGTKLLGFINFGGSTDRVIAPIAIGENVLFVPDEVGVFALNKETGELLNWKLDTARAVWSQPIYVPATDGKPAMLYVSSLDHHLYALDVSEIDLEDTVDEIKEAEAVEALWKADLESAIAGQPTFDAENNILFLGTFGDKLFAVDAANGEILAEYEAKGWVWEGATLYDGTLYFGDVQGYLHAVTYSDKEFTEVWSRQISEGKLRAKPIVTEQLVIIGSDDKNLYAVRRDTGEGEWAREIDTDNAEMLSDLVWIEGEEDEILLVTATKNKDDLVLAIRLDNGNERWSYKHED